MPRTSQYNEVASYTCMLRPKFEVYTRTRHSHTNSNIVGCLPRRNWLTSVVESSLLADTGPGVENDATVIAAYLQGNEETCTKINNKTDKLKQTKQTRPALAEIRTRVYVGSLAARPHLFCFVNNDSCTSPPHRETISCSCPA